MIGGMKGEVAQGKDQETTGILETTEITEILEITEIVGTRVDMTTGDLVTIKTDDVE